MIQFEDIKHFMELAGQSTGHLNHEQTRLYSNLVSEELTELNQSQNAVETFDAILDSIWTLVGLGYSMGFPMTAGMQEVIASNMSKVVDGQLMKREDGKILKPDTFFPPDLGRILSLHGLTTKPH